MRGLQIHPVGSPRGSGRLDIHPRNRFPPLSPLPSPPSPSRLSPHAPPLNPPIRPPPAVSPLSCPLPLIHQHVTPPPFGASVHDSARCFPPPLPYGAETGELCPPPSLPPSAFLSLLLPPRPLSSSPSSSSRSSTRWCREVVGRFSGGGVGADDVRVRHVGCRRNECFPCSLCPPGPMRCATVGSVEHLRCQRPRRCPYVRWKTVLMEERYQQFDGKL